jgi:hypothetical protein
MVTSLWMKAVRVLLETVAPPGSERRIWSLLIKGASFQKRLILLGKPNWNPGYFDYMKEKRSRADEIKVITYCCCTWNGSWYCRLH